MPDLESKRNVLLLIIAVLVAVLLVGWIAWKFMIAPPAYHAVSLSSGELYFGELQKFPQFGLKNVYTLQVTQNQQQPFSIQRFDSAFWGPDNFLKINKENVVWMAELSDQSQLLQVIQQNPNLLPQQQVPQGSQAVPGANQQQTDQQGAGQQAPLPQGAGQ